MNIILSGHLPVARNARYDEDSSAAGSGSMEPPLRIIGETPLFALPALYVASAALQAYDAYSTLGTLRARAVEANPLMRGVAGSPAVLITLKAAVFTTSIYAAERLWRQHHRTRAILLMVLSNGLMSAVAAHNTSVIRRQK